MIPASDITKWSISHPWATRDNIEQDFLLSQAICEIAKDTFLGNELVIRGGTAFHKLFLPKPLRYSEDLDYVRTTAGGIGPIMNQLSIIGENLGYKVNSSLSKYPKVLWKNTAESGQLLKIKIEINTYERSPSMSLITIFHNVETEYYKARAAVRTFQPEELVATKIRALYQRSKGRDLFDIWLALEMLSLNPETILSAFESYRPEGMTSNSTIKNLIKKLENRQFIEDLDNLAILREIGYEPAIAGGIIINKLLCKL